MRVELVIQELLYKKNFITIPGFGSLVSKYQPARIIKSDKVKFVPPHKVVAFNASITQNDNTLVQTISADYQLTFEQALLEVTNFVANIIAVLEQKKQFQIKDLGIFYYDAERNIKFQSDKNINYLTETFGLSGFSVQAIPQQEILDEAIRKYEEETDPIRKRILKSLFIAIPIIFALILIPNILHLPQSAGLFNWFEETEVYVDLTEPNKPLPEQSSAYFNNPEPSNAVYDTPLAVNAAPEVKSVEQTPFVESKIQAELRATYYIIVGSYTSKWKANKAAQKLQATFSEAGVVISSNKIRVYATTHKTREEAVESRKSIRQEKGFESAWLFTQE